MLKMIALNHINTLIYEGQENFIILQLMKIHILNEFHITLQKYLKV